MNSVIPAGTDWHSDLQEWLHCGSACMESRAPVCGMAIAASMCCSNAKAGSCAETRRFACVRRSSCSCARSCPNAARWSYAARSGSNSPNTIGHGAWTLLHGLACQWREVPDLTIINVFSKQAPTHYATLLVLFFGVFTPLRVFAHLAEDVREHEVFSFDRPVLMFMHSHATEALDMLTTFISRIGSFPVLVPSNIFVFSLLNHQKNAGKKHFFGFSLY